MPSPPVGGCAGVKSTYDTKPRSVRFGEAASGHTRPL